MSDSYSRSGSDASDTGYAKSIAKAKYTKRNSFAVHLHKPGSAVNEDNTGDREGELALK
jgi:hypothetical protein